MDVSPHSIKEMNVLRPANRDSSYVPAHQDGVVFHCRKAEAVRHDKYDDQGVHRRAWDHELWLHGERKYVNPQGQVAYKSVSVKVFNFAYYVFFDATGMDHATITSVVEAINLKSKRSKSQPDPVTRWELVKLKSFIGFDYEAFLANGGTTYPERPYVKMYLKNPNVLYNVKEVFGQAIVDHRNVSHTLICYHSDYDWGSLFLMNAECKLQDWVKFKQGTLRAVHPRNRQTFSDEEYMCTYQPGVLNKFEEDMDPALCATLRVRVGSRAGKKMGKNMAPTYDSEDQVVSICSNLYWVGHNSQTVKLRFYVGEQGSDKVLEPPEKGIQIEKAFPNALAMIKAWRDTMRMASVDVYVSLQDVGNDIMHLMKRLQDHNLSRYKGFYNEMRAKPRFPSEFYYKMPGITEVNLVDYMKKMMIKPQFDAYKLIDAYSHPKVYHGPAFKGLETHRPNGVSLMDPRNVLKECAIEADVIQYVEMGPAIYTDALALSKVVTLCTTRIVSNGQQQRIMSRFQHDAHRKAFLINKERLSRPPLTVDSKQYNSFPEPPELVNVALRYRDEDFDQRWRESIEKNPLPDNMPFRKIREPPPLDSFPPTKVMRDANGNVRVKPDLASELKSAGVSKGDAPGPSKRSYAQRDLMGNKVIYNTTKKRQKTATRPKKKKYEGGYVATPQEGHYCEPYEVTATEDFSSLYPSIIMAEGYCYSNLGWDPRVLDDDRLTKKYVEISPGDSIVFITHVNGEPVPTIMPETEKELVAERTRIKKLMEDAQKKVSSLLDELKLPETTTFSQVQDRIHEEENPVVRDMLTELAQWMTKHTNYDKQQLGSKVTQNAVFGFTGVEKNGIMPCVVLMAAITATGRWMIKVCRWYTIRYYKGCSIYGGKCA